MGQISLNKFSMFIYCCKYSVIDLPWCPFLFILYYSIFFWRWWRPSYNPEAPMYDDRYANRFLLCHDDDNDILFHHEGDRWADEWREQNIFRAVTSLLFPHSSINNRVFVTDWFGVWRLSNRSVCVCMCERVWADCHSGKHGYVVRIG